MIWGKTIFQYKIIAFVKLRKNNRNELILYINIYSHIVQLNVKEPTHMLNIYLELRYSYIN
jgi:hypothetical protein